ncbi:hypothetical protein HFP89_11535 [Wenzhouxiangella sp. XN79A]|uniref:heme biosynthesis protein HemY n=1 Tax=Wenzhouxiangella sp. XN79A TaxID=2724193 RepID=UPI00144AA256|nr:heme biosynthesis HemY N-terminal domain-containing protein [Wenzhouxiangella sp. XN79A]NKI35794.1 hypothetical protein [Wenzhouxiangella sp. XN79A]
MKRLVVLIVLLLVLALAVIGGAWLAPRLLDDPGYVLVEFGGWRLQMSLLVLVGGVLLSWLALAVVVALLRAPGRAARTLRDARDRRNLDRGLMALTEGRWADAERALNKTLAHHGSTAGYLAAARAAQGQGAEQRRDGYLEHADRRFGQKHFITQLTRARLLLADGDAEGAIAPLEELHLKKPKHEGVLRLLLQAYQQAERWHELRLLVPAMRKADLVDAERAQGLVELAAGRELAAAHDVAALQSTWRALKGGLKQRPEVVAAFARRALELDRAELAEPELRRVLAGDLDDDLLVLYAQADEADRAARIKHCREWLARAPESAALQLALGRLYLDAREDERAREHLEAAVRARPDAEAFAALARVFDRGGQLEAATRCYRNALRLEQGRAPEPLPAPGASSASSSP